jgi:hypothetical protein
MPHQGVRLQASDAYLIPFSLLWGGFALFWEYNVVTMGAPPFFTVWGIPFVLIGVYLIIGRFFWDAYRRSRTRYALTDQRIIIVNAALGRRVESIQLMTLGQLQLSVRPDRSGTITLGPTTGLRGSLATAGWPGSRKHAPPTLEGIADARAIHDRILTAQDELRSAEAPGLQRGR